MTDRHAEFIRISRECWIIEYANIKEQTTGETGIHKDTQTYVAKCVFYYREEKEIDRQVDALTLNI